MHNRLLVAKFVISVVHEPGLPMAPSRPCSLLHPAQLLPSKALLGDLSCRRGKAAWALSLAHVTEVCGCSPSVPLCESDL